MRHSNLETDIVINAELKALSEEGYVITELQDWVKEHIDSRSKSAYEDIFWEKATAIKKASKNDSEPSLLDQIKKLRPTHQTKKYQSLGEKSIKNKIEGAWLGRCAGCTLGKPVELWPRQRIREYLIKNNSYPLDFYIPAEEPVPEWVNPWTDYERTTRGNITKMVRDDDIDYTILGLKILEMYGRDFSAIDVGRSWQENFPFYTVFTAEAAVYRNLINDISPADTATYRNPYREFIGAQIRADVWGYINPGNPEEAAEMAFRDASLSHTKNGIYGEMWAAACIAAAFYEDDAIDIIRAGLDQIPEFCRLSQAIKQTMEWSKQFDDWEKVCDLIFDTYGHYDTVHIINNTCLIVMGLIMGKGDLEKSLSITLMGGLDTDCTCATVGSILGVVIGADSLPPKWITPLNNTVESYVIGFERSSILDLAGRTLRFIEQIY